jgi:choline monooxygenase
MLNLDPALYATSRSFLEERERIFSRTWQLIGPASRLPEPGSYVATELAGLKLFVLRGRDGALRAFRNVCRHRGARLLEEGTGRCAGPVRCPYHNWSYDDQGRLVAMPWFGEEASFEKRIGRCTGSNCASGAASSSSPSRRSRSWRRSSAT